MATSDILAYLIEQQVSAGLSGREMAARLGMREQEWSRIRNGHRPLGPLQRERAARAFPGVLEILFARAKAS